MDEKRKRIKRVFVILGIAGMFLLAYAVFYAITGIAIPCIFHEITGFRCPGCGISTFSVLALKMKWKEAIFKNLMAPFIYIYMLWVLFDFCKRYINTGKNAMMPQPEILNWIFLTAMAVWSIIRNIVGI